MLTLPTNRPKLEYLFHLGGSPDIEYSNHARVKFKVRNKIDGTFEDVCNIDALLTSGWSYDKIIGVAKFNLFFIHYIDDHKPIGKVSNLYCDMEYGLNNTNKAININVTTDVSNKEFILDIFFFCPESDKLVTYNYYNLVLYLNQISGRAVSEYEMVFVNASNDIVDVIPSKLIGGNILIPGSVSDFSVESSVYPNLNYITYNISPLKEEKKVYSETVLYSGASNTNVTLSSSVDEFDAVVVYTYISSPGSGDGGDTTFIPKSLYGTNINLEFAQSAGAASINVSGTTVKFAYQWNPPTTYIGKVIGLNFNGGGVRLNKHIKLFKPLLKEVA